MKIHLLGTGAYPLRTSEGKSLSIFFPEEHFCIDAGIGLTALPTDYHADEFHILLSHYHHDHILGLAFLANFIENGQLKRIVIHGDERIPELARFFGEPFNPTYTSSQLPIAMEIMKSTISIHGCMVVRHPVPHASGFSNILVISKQNQTIAFVTDTTARSEYAKWFESCDLLIHECNYDNAHARQAKSEGHSYPDALLELANKSKCKRLVIIHHDPRYPLAINEILAGWPSAEIANDNDILII